MSTQSSHRPKRREAATEERRAAILDAALQEFAEKGFAGARLDDVAKRAGVAKGTIYLLAKDKNDLLQQIVLGKLSPLLERLAALPALERATLDEFRALMTFFNSEVMHSNRKLVAQLVIKEAGRFPDLAEFYYREVVTKILAFAGAAAERARAEGLLRSDAYARFPQLIIAPLLFSLIWDANFSKLAPLDVAGLLAAHFEALFDAPLTEETRK